VQWIEVVRRPDPRVFKANAIDPAKHGTPMTRSRKRALTTSPSHPWLSQEYTTRLVA